MVSDPNLHAVVLPLDGHHAPRDRTRTAWRDQFQQQIVAIAHRIFATVHRVARGTRNEVATRVQRAIGQGQGPVLFGVSAAGFEVCDAEGDSNQWVSKCVPRGFAVKKVGTAGKVTL